jgi:hypothetical protein
MGHLAICSLFDTIGICSWKIIRFTQFTHFTFPIKPLKSIYTKVFRVLVQKSKAGFIYS